jgi:rhodanese-related sulfurtransferase/uncharacterized membrane protein YedE/YeeE
MNAPFYKFGAFDENVSLIVAFLIGLAFGFFLERAGFGSGNKLARQFYFRDLAVLKVMFTGIVTAMLGVFFLSRLGFMDLSQVYLTPTYYGGAVVGGLVLGVGFVIGGYCPGTSVVAAATGRIDGMIYMLGMFAGMLVVSFYMPELAGLIESGARGPLTLSSAWNVSYGVLVLSVALIAVAAFIAAEWAEVKTGARVRAEQPLLGRKGFTRPRQLLATFVGLAGLAALAGSPYRGNKIVVSEKALAQLVSRQADSVSVDELADRLITGKNDLRVLDLRSEAAYRRYHLPGAEHLPMAALATTDLRADEGYLVYADDEAPAAQAWVMLKARGLPQVYALRGGLSEWQDRVLFPRVAADAVGEGKREGELRAAIARHFGGAPRGGEGPGAAPAELKLPTPPPPSDAAPAGGGPLPKKKKKEGC